MQIHRYYVSIFKTCLTNKATPDNYNLSKHAVNKTTTTKRQDTLILQDNGMLIAYLYLSFTQLNTCCKTMYGNLCKLSVICSFTYNLNINK